MKSTKKSLVLSALSLMMCVAMLLGTTYAWFTDSVTSGKNKIQAGNLDVELVSAAKGTVDETTQLFAGVSKWEPGVAVYDTLTVKNVGNLALKYQMNLIFDNEIKVDGHGLSEVLKVGTYSGEITSETKRETVIAGVSDWAPISTFSKGGTLAASTDDGGTTYVIYWQPGDSDNLYNMNNTNQGKTLSIDFGVELVATQNTVESDSFGIDYDKNAPWLGGSNAEALEANTDDSAKTVKIETADQLAAFAAAVSGGKNYKGYTVTLENNIDLGNVTWNPIGTFANSFEGTFDGNGKTVSNLKVNKTSEAGFFGNIVSPAVVKNLTIKNATVKGESNVGVLAGSAYTGLVENCKITGQIKVDGNYHVGGITGQAYAKISNVDIDAAAGSYVKATYLKADREGDAVGGAVGYLREGNITMENCDVKGLAVTGTRKVGGLIGQVDYNEVVDSCTFDGTVTVAGPSTYFTDNEGKIFAGGVVGEITGSTVTIKNCTVKGTLTGKEPAHTGALTGGSRKATPPTIIGEDTNTVTGMTVN